MFGAGILTRFPSATTLVLTLGADSPCADERGAGNLGLTATEPFTLFIATHVSIRTSDTSSKGLPSPSQAYGTLSYHSYAPRARLSLRHTPSRSGRLDFNECIAGASLTHAPSSVLGGAYEIHSFGAQFEPRYIFRAGRLDQ